MSFNNVWTKRKTTSGSSWDTGTQTKEVATQELASLKERLSELEAKGLAERQEGYSPLTAIRSLLDDETAANMTKPKPGCCRSMSGSSALPVGLPPPPPPPGPGAFLPGLVAKPPPELPVGPLGEVVEPTPKRASAFETVAETSERNFSVENPVNFSVENSFSFADQEVRPNNNSCSLNEAAMGSFYRGAGASSCSVQVSKHAHFSPSTVEKCVTEDSEQGLEELTNRLLLGQEPPPEGYVPVALEGPLFKKSPAGPIYQERIFHLRDGVFSYVSGKGELVELPVAQFKAIEVRDAYKFEFVIVSTTGREYAFRASTEKRFKVWVPRLHLHMAFEPQRVAATKIESAWRGRTAQSAYVREKELVLGVQAKFRQQLARRVEAGDAAQYVREAEVARMRARVAALQLRVEGPNHSAAAPEEAPLGSARGPERSKSLGLLKKGSAAASAEASLSIGQKSMTTSQKSLNGLNLTGSGKNAWGLTSPRSGGGGSGGAAAAASTKGAARHAVQPLSGVLQKQSPAFPHGWQKREVEVAGEALLYKAGGGVAC